MRNKPLSLAGQAFVRFMIQFLVGCFETFTYFCGKDNLDNRLKFINSVFILLCLIPKIMSSSKPYGFEECCPGVTRFNS
jgi:hypothetical protein